MIFLFAARANENVAPNQEGVSGRRNIMRYIVHAYTFTFAFLIFFLFDNLKSVLAFVWPRVEARGDYCDHFEIGDSAEKDFTDLDKEIEESSHIAEKLQKSICFSLDHDQRPRSMYVKRHELVVFREVFNHTRPVFTRLKDSEKSSFFRLAQVD